MTGSITGTPNAVTATATYTVTARNSGGSTAATLTLSVGAAAAPSNLTYSTPAATYSVGVAIAANTPSSSGGAVAAYSVRPSLPPGLALDASTGILTGTPNTATASATYTVTATNPFGTAQVVLTLTVAGVVAPVADLLLPNSVHPGDAWMLASVASQPGMTYLWSTLPGTSAGAITAGQGTTVAGFSAGTSVGTFQVQANVQNAASSHATTAKTVTAQTGTWLIENGGPGNAAY